MTPAVARPGVRRRVVAVVLLTLTVAAGLVVTRLPDSAASDIAGDALYTVAAYLLVVGLAPRLHAAVVAGIAAVWCIGVELFQLTGLPELWSASFPPVMLVFGTVFDARDLAVYAATAVLCGLVDAAARRVARLNSSDPVR